MIVPEKILKSCIGSYIKKFRVVYIGDNLPTKKQISEALTYEEDYAYVKVVKKSKQEIEFLVYFYYFGFSGKATISAMYEWLLASDIDDLGILKVYKVKEEN